MDLQSYLSEIFEPQPGETALVLTDVPTSRARDTPVWRERRTLAARWRDALNRLGLARGFSVLPLAQVPASQHPLENLASLALPDLANVVPVGGQYVECDE